MYELRETPSTLTRQQVSFSCFPRFSFKVSSEDWRRDSSPPLILFIDLDTTIPEMSLAEMSVIASDSPLVNIVSGIEERQCDLIGRHRNLRDKIATMERSIPALMAYNMWMAERDCPDTPYCKVRKIMNKFSPHPDPADRLVAELKSTVDQLRQETAQLHDKIVDADVKLEETDMELESLELANKEMEERLTGLRNDVRKHSTSLHSIHSDDLICLKKIRRLAQEEFKLKNCIKQLESKEIMYRRQMNKLLPSCQRYRCEDRRTKRVQKLDTRSDKESSFCPLNGRRCDLLAELKKKRPLKDKKRVRPPYSCCVSLDNRTRERCDYPLCCGACQKLSVTTFPAKSTCSANAPTCESLFGVASATGLTETIEPIEPPIPCDFGKTCNECKETPAACKQMTDNCVCACELSFPSLDYNVATLSTFAKKTHRSSPTLKSLRLESEADDSNSDDEFCECCPCDYVDTENSS